MEGGIEDRRQDSEGAKGKEKEREEIGREVQGEGREVEQKMRGRRRREQRRRKKEEEKEQRRKRYRR